MDAQAILKEIESFQKQFDALKQLKSRMEGEKESLLKQQHDLEKQALEETGNQITDFPKMIKEYDEKIQERLEILRKLFNK
ncbi:MAG: hypothetical protein M0P12_00500 [Paludibacteraceae bacterium]|nr:hypothetical protein [Paludibacteraceae bacterium]